MKLKRINWKDLEVGKSYIIIPTGCKYSIFSRPIIFVGFYGKHQKAHFTFASQLIDWKHAFGYICTHNYKFYVEE